MFPNERPEPPAEGVFPAKNPEFGVTPPFPAACAHVENHNPILCTTGSTPQAFHKPLWIGPPLFPPKMGPKSPQRRILCPMTYKNHQKADFSRSMRIFPPEVHRKSLIRQQASLLLSNEKRLVRQGHFHFPQYPPPIRILLLVFLCILMYRISLSYARAREAAAQRRSPAGQGLSHLKRILQSTPQRQSPDSAIHKPYRRHIYCHYPRSEREQEFTPPYNQKAAKAVVYNYTN